MQYTYLTYTATAELMTYVWAKLNPDYAMLKERIGGVQLVTSELPSFGTVPALAPITHNVLVNLIGQPPNSTPDTFFGSIPQLSAHHGPRSFPCPFFNQPVLHKSLLETPLLLRKTVPPS